jgi:hypothetical protein
LGWGLIFLGLLDIPHIKAALLAGFQQTGGHQLVVGRHHRVRADAVLRSALAHAGQARASGQQPVFNALGKTGYQLVGQAQGRGAHQHGGYLSRASVYQ